VFSLSAKGEYEGGSLTMFTSGRVVSANVLVRSLKCFFVSLSL